MADADMRLALARYARTRAPEDAVRFAEMALRKQGCPPTMHLQAQDAVEFLRSSLGAERVAIEARRDGGHSVSIEHGDRISVGTVPGSCALPDCDRSPLPGQINPPLCRLHACQGALGHVVRDGAEFHSSHHARYVEPIPAGCSLPPDAAEASHNWQRVPGEPSSTWLREGACPA